MQAEDFPVVTAFCAYNGESYADIPTVKRTVGFIPPQTRDERERRTYEVSDFAREAGIPSIATHIGFVPEDDTDPDYMAVRGMVRRICDHAARNHQTFALETGQEPADTLLRFLIDVNRRNLGINFDPANMILYGTGDPVDALGNARPACDFGSLQRWRLAPQGSARRTRRRKAAGPRRGGDATLRSEIEIDRIQGPAEY